MYNYKWDESTGGYILTTELGGVIKEVRPVFKEELRLLGFDKKFGWVIPETDAPIMWAEGRRYIYKGALVAEASGGGLYELPTIKSECINLVLEQVNIPAMVEKNKKLMDGLVQKTLTFIYNTYKEFSDKVTMFYVAFSGGKDSIVMLDLVQRALPHDSFFVVFGNTTMEFNATLQAVKKMKTLHSDLKWIEARSQYNATESWKKVGFPGRTQRWCCCVHKSAPSILAIRKELEKIAGKIEKFRVMAFDGVRAEESDVRATYSDVSLGKKHIVQDNCSPLLNWNTSELFLYMLEHSLFLNEIYKYGSSRVGCKLCPMASTWYESILYHTYADEINPFLEIIEHSLNKQFESVKDKQDYLQNGGWKSRAGGKELINGENKVLEIKTVDKIKYVISDSNYRWDTWMSPVGELIPIGKNRFSLTRGHITMTFSVEYSSSATTIVCDALEHTKDAIRFMYLFKNALNKAAYCINCKVCMVECPTGAVIIDDDNIKFENCVHCGACLDMQKGCLVAKSLNITGGGNNMSVKNISRYQNFGFRQEWLEWFFEMGDEFWTNEQMGKYMLIGFKVWLKESGITNNNALTTLGTQLKLLGSDSLITWGTIFTNLAYGSPIIKWYVQNIDFGNEHSAEELTILLGDDYSNTTRQNALASLKETLRLSPIGRLLGAGICTMKGKTVQSIIRHGWNECDPIVLLYSLYKIAETSGFYSFTASQLFNNDLGEDIITPKQLFGLTKEQCIQIMTALSHDYSDFISVAFNKDLENINLTKEKTSLDVIKLA